MSHHHAGHEGRADRFDHIAAILATYPDTDEAGIAELKEWFRKASAFDVASLAANDATTAGYTRFRADHIDRLTLADHAKMVAGIMLLVAVLAGIGALAP